LVNTLHEIDIVPNSAVQRGAPGTFVYVVKPEKTVAVQKVKLGPSDGQRIAILSGLEPGERVVIDGTDRLRDGAKVTISSPQPAASAAETPPQPRAQGQKEGSARRRSTP
jgi:multidrug efflux system membrane fusion protein